MVRQLRDTSQFQEIGVDYDADIRNLPDALRSKAQELLDIAQSLEASIGVGVPHLSVVPAPHIANDREAEQAPKPRKHLGELAKQIYQFRRLRSRIFKDETLFGEPAWDILLDLFAASCHSKRVAVTSACIGASVPGTTALRWIKVLEDKQLIHRESDASDARRTFVRLSEEGHALMLRFFSEAEM